MRSARLFGLLVLPLFLASPASAVEWDLQQAVTTARQLSTALTDLLATVLDSQPRPGNEELYEAFVGDLRLADQQAGVLVEQLEAGAGRDETAPTYASIREAGQQGLKRLQEARPSAESDHMLQPVSALIWRLGGFYPADGDGD